MRARLKIAPFLTASMLLAGCSDDKPLVLPNIEHAQGRRERLRNLVEAARQKRRVREIDMMHEDY